MDLTPEELQAAQKAAPDAKRFQKAKFNGRTFIFRNPTRIEYKQFRQVFAQDKGELPAFEALAETIVVIPSPQEWQADVLVEYPGAGSNPEIQKALANLTGIASEETSK